MTEDQETQTVSENPRKRGRPPGRKEDPALTILRREIAALRDKFIEATSHPAPTAPEATPERRPGTYVVTGRDPLGREQYSKVRWTRPWIEKLYDKITFTPAKSMAIYPHGVQYDIVGGQEWTGPSIVKAIYEEHMRSIPHDLANRMPSPSPDEHHKMDQRAKAEGRVYSRLHFLGVGLNMGPEEAEGVVAAPKE